MGSRLDSLSCVQGSYTAPNRGWLAPSEIGDVYGDLAKGDGRAGDPYGPTLVCSLPTLGRAVGRGGTLKQAYGT